VIQLLSLNVFRHKTYFLIAILLCALLSSAAIANAATHDPQHTVQYAVLHAAKQQGANAMLAIIGADGNVTVYDSNGRNPIRLTTDAIPGQHVYQWPTWASDGRLAFFGASSDLADPYTLRVFVVDQVTPTAVVQTAYSSRDEIFTYAYWSPGDCGSSSASANTNTCRDLALLYTPPDQSGLGLRLIRDKQGTFTDRVVGQASPFYYSFAPDGQHMLWFQDSDTLRIYDVAADKVSSTLADQPGKFQAPMWSPVDSRLLFGTVSSTPDKTDVVLADGADRHVLIHATDSPISFAWSPDAKAVASVAGYAEVNVTDVQSGKTITTGSHGDVVAHYWSPQSDRVAYLVVNRDTPGTQARLRSNGHTPAEQATGGLTWYVLDVKSGSDQALVTFSPSRDMVYMLNFFDQFARSHSVWSPDGRYLTYGSTDTLGKPAVMIVDTRSATVSPIKVAAGSIGVWSWQ